jgi:hypothetical protein
MDLLRDAVIQDLKIRFLQAGHGFALVGYQDIQSNFFGCDGEHGLWGGGHEQGCKGFLQATLSHFGSSLKALGISSIRPVASRTCATS